MKQFNEKTFIFIIGIMCISIPVLLAIYQSTRQSLTEAELTLVSFANNVVFRANKTGEQIFNNLTKLNAENKNSPCSAKSVSTMRVLDISSSNIQALGYIENHTLMCSSLDSHPLIWDLGPVDLVTSAGTSIRFNVTFPDSDTSFVIVEKDHFGVIIHKDLVVESTLFNNGISLGVFSRDNLNLYATKGFIDPDWFKQLGNKNKVTFLQEGYAIALVKSEQFKIAAVAAMPFSYLNPDTIKTALILVPVGVIAGLLLTYIFLYWMRQQISSVAILKTGLKRKEFYLVYQPVFDVRTNRCIGAEVLLRWKRSSGEMIPPDEFIPLAEKHGLICQLTDLVLELVAKEAKDLFKTYPDFHLAINVSPDDLHSSNIIASLQKLVLKTNAGPDNLIIEATERKILDLEILKQTLQEIHGLGIKVAIDDFGTGYSNLSYLETLEIDYLKIDKSFVDAVGTGSSTSQVILHIIEMAKALNLQIIAEGVVNKEQAEFILNKGVQFAQGWLYSKPTSLENVLLLLQQKD